MGFCSQVRGPLLRLWLSHAERRSALGMHGCLPSLLPSPLLTCPCSAPLIPLPPQITAGSLLPLKAPVMRGTVIDILARRGHVEVCRLFFSCVCCLPSALLRAHCWRCG